MGNVIFKPRAIPTSIRWMIRRDMQEVLATEAGTSDPWSEEALLTMLRKRNCIGMSVETGEHGERIVGHILYTLHKTRIHVERFAVHKDFRRRGVFRAITKKLQSKLSPERRTEATAIVCETDLDALLAMKATGWVATELLRDHFWMGDGIHMVLPLDAITQRD